MPNSVTSISLHQLYRTPSTRLYDTASAAFILAHELGHRTGKLKDERKAEDPGGANDENNQQVYEACFKN